MNEPCHDLPQSLPTVVSTGPLALLACDDCVTAVTVREALQQRGYRVTECADAAGLRAGLEAGRVDVVLLDTALPGVDPFGLCSTLRESIGVGTPILMITDHLDEGQVHRAYEAGATDFVPKPVNGEVLNHRVRYLQRAAEVAENLRRSEEKLTKAQRIAQLGWWEWDLRTDNVDCSHEFFHIFGLDRAAFGASYQSLLQCVPRGDREILRGKIEESLRTGLPFTIDHRIVRPDGSERTVFQQAEVAHDADGRPHRVVCTIQDITQRKQAEEQIRFLAYFDSLTGLPNRRHFIERFNRALDTAGRHSRLVAILFLDLDRFKRINDTLGHGAGDDLLKEVASRLLSSLRKSDCVGRQLARDEGSVVARLGGDEFIVLLPEITRVQDAAKVAQRVIDALAEPFDLQGQEVVVTTSIGLTLYPFDGEDAGALLKNADTAMYHAKDQGRNNYQFYNESMNATAFERLVLEASLRRALEREEFILHFQPQVRLGSGEIFGAEALIRWHHPEMGLVPPGKFIPLAEETGLILPIGEWALRTACVQLREWQQQGLPAIRMAVNVSTPQFSDPGFVAAVARILEETGIDSNDLDLELTESILMADVETAVRSVKELKSLGIWLSVDDFGTGYSSLSYLRRFSLDTLKVDQSFLRDVPQDQDHVAITTAIVAMARSLNLGVIAEGVETAQQVDFLRQLGCGEAQGFLFSRPVPADEFAALLRKGRIG